MKRDRPAAKKRVLQRQTTTEQVSLSQRDSRLVIELLQNPPAPNDKLRKAARTLLGRS
jgi:uncharacterized protein (DUF1778 family)